MRWRCRRRSIEALTLGRQGRGPEQGLGCRPQDLPGFQHLVARWILPHAAKPKPVVLRDHPCHRWILPEPPALFGAPGYALGTVIDARSGGNAQPYLRRGWSRQERWGCWGVGLLHELRFRLSPPQPRLLTLSLSLSAAVYEPRSRARTVFSLNGHALGDITFTQGSREQDVTLPVPAEALRSDGLLVLTLENDDAPSPNSFGWSEDARPLGIRLVTLSLIAAS